MSEFLHAIAFGFIGVNAFITLRFFWRVYQAHRAAAFLTRTINGEIE